MLLLERTEQAVHEFDFLHGNWNIRNRFLARRLAGCTEWIEFDAIGRAYPTLGGAGNCDHFSATFVDGEPLEGMSIRIYDPVTRLWNIWWADNRQYTVLPPVSGRILDGEGEFYGEDFCDDIPVNVMYRWSDITPMSAKWAQSFSANNGKTWELNWEMYFTRAGG